MVKLEGATGSVVLVSPGAVKLLAEGPTDGQTVVHIGGVFSATVKGTPDDVHAKLFPEAKAASETDWKAVADELAQRQFLPTEFSECYAPLIARHTRTALGR